MTTTDSRTCFPIYILPDGLGWLVLISPGRRDLPHPALWRLCAARILAQRMGIALQSLEELPYACHRARIVGRTVYWGSDLDAAQRQAVTAALRKIGLQQLTWVHDDHEIRQEDDCRRFNALRSLK